MFRTGSSKSDDCEDLYITMCDAFIAPHLRDPMLLKGAAARTKTFPGMEQNNQPRERTWTAIGSFDYDTNSPLDILTGISTGMASAQESKPHWSGTIRSLSRSERRSLAACKVAKGAILGALVKLFRKHSAVVSSADAHGSSHSQS